MLVGLYVFEIAGKSERIIGGFPVICGVSLFYRINSPHNPRKELMIVWVIHWRVEKKLPTCWISLVLICCRYNAIANEMGNIVLKPPIWWNAIFLWFVFRIPGCFSVGWACFRWLGYLKESCGDVWQVILKLFKLQHGATKRHKHIVALPTYI